MEKLPSISWKVLAAVLVLFFLIMILVAAKDLKIPGCVSGGIFDCLKMPIDIVDKAAGG